MRQAGEEQGRRLLDVLDVHWYPEVRINDVRITANEPVGDPETMRGRVHATRSLWQADYEEESWIGQWRKPVRLLGRLQDSVDQYYPGTGICIGEYNYGGARDVSGALAQADFLGVCGREGVSMACHWGALRGFTLAGYQIWRNYDGRNSTFGDTGVGAITEDPNDTAAYASLDDEGALHVILINRKFDDPVTFNLNITHDEPLNGGRAWFVDGKKPEVQPGGEVQGIEGNRLTYTAPPLTVHHLVLK
jgi:mannan endo-1,4-beta-mannosidase